VGLKMCQGCWDEVGRPTLWNSKVKRAVELIAAVYAAEPTGGPLHAVIDDWNIDDSDILVEEYVAGEGVGKCSPGADAAIRELMPLLGEMTVAERASALARGEGYFSPPEAES
jgi:hypothetical protein